MIAAEIQYYSVIVPDGYHSIHKLFLGTIKTFLQVTVTLQGLHVPLGAPSSARFDVRHPAAVLWSTLIVA
jgi:hypothetical protein